MSTWTKADVHLHLASFYRMKLNKIETKDAVSLTKPAYSIPPELEAAWLGYKHSIEKVKGSKEDHEAFWKTVAEEVEAGLEGLKPWKRDEGEMIAQRGHGVPLSGEFDGFSRGHLISPIMRSLIMFYV
jgi:hypothetical protein